MTHITTRIYHNIPCAPLGNGLSAVLQRAGQNPAPFPPGNAEMRPDKFCACAWLCTEVNGGRFHVDVVTKGGFPAQNPLNNGERVRSLLCEREALPDERSEPEKRKRCACAIFFCCACATFLPCSCTLSPCAAGAYRHWSCTLRTGSHAPQILAAQGLKAGIA